MGWGQARRPKVSNKLGIPNPREGSDGDIQVRQTGLGARLFAKLGGRWLSNVLYGNEIDNPDIIIPKAWVYRGTTPDFVDALGGGATLNKTISLPEFITNSNIISWHLFLEQTFGSITELAPVQFGEVSDAQYEDMEMYVFLLSASRIRIQGTSASTDAANKPYILTVFFK